MATKSTTKKSTGKKAAKTPAKGSKAATKKPARTKAGFSKNNVPDNLTAMLNAKKLVPAALAGTDKYLDVVSWNIRWFDASDSDRVKGIADVLAALNADILVLTEIAADGALDEVVKKLAQKKAGFYSTFYGTTGKEQRVVMMWDRDWVRAKTDLMELFKEEDLTVPSEVDDTKRQSVFPRLPLWGYFECLGEKPGDEGFTFELVGLHLKAQGPAPQGYTGDIKRFGIPQRTKAAKRLTEWLMNNGDHYDTDVVVVGDWNAKPSEPEWKAFRDKEEDGEFVFTDINDEADASHLVRLNASGPAGSRIDLHLITKEADANAVPKNKGVVIRWSPFDHLDAMGGKERQEYFKLLTLKFSDHLPVVSRFYLNEVA